MSPTKTKFFGIVPKGKRVDVIQAKVTAAGYNFEAIAAPITSKDLDAVADKLVDLARRMLTRVP